MMRLSESEEYAGFRQSLTTGAGVVEQAQANNEAQRSPKRRDQGIGIISTSALQIDLL
jgi:hypothetical protein